MTSVKSFIVVFVAILGGLAGVLGNSKDLLNFYDRMFMPEVTGRWRIDIITKKTSFTPYLGLKLGYVVYFDQNDAKIIGKGEKWFESTQKIHPSIRDEIEMVGEIDGEQIGLSFTVHGRKRKTKGAFNFTKSQGIDGFVGTFSWTAADSSGSATMVPFPVN